MAASAAGIDVLRVDGDERVAASGCDHLGPQALEDFGQQVASHRGVLIDHYPLAAKRASLEKVREPLDVSGTGFGIFRWKSLMAGLEKAKLIE